MTADEYGDAGGAASSAREGLFDAQLFFPETVGPDAFGSTLARPDTIKKRDGRVVAFEPQKIVDAIGKSAKSIGREDRGLALGLAPAIGLYLAKASKGAIPTADDVHEAVERVLVEMGHGRTAAAYTQFRSRRHRIEALRAKGAGAADASDGTDLDGTGSEVQGSGLPFEMPIEEVEAIVCAPGATGDTRWLDPDATGRILAERMKAAFALNGVLPREVKQGHLLGDIHVHGLGWIDRLETLVLPLEYLKRFGRPDEGLSPAPPPDSLEELIVQMSGFTGVLQRYFTRCIGWDAVNFYLAPMLGELDGRPLKGLARMLLDEFRYAALSQARPGARVELGICWDVPEYLAGLDAVGFRGALAGRSYEGFVHDAQRFAWALVDAYQELHDEEAWEAAPIPVFHFEASFSRSPGHEGFLNHASGLAACGGEVEFRFHRAPPVLTHTDDIVAPREALAHSVTLNLPRAALRNRDEAGLFESLDRLVDLALSAHIAKRSFIERLLRMRDGGPLELLSAARGGGRLIQLERCIFVVGVLGLNECVQALTGAGLDDSGAGVLLAERILSRIRVRCREWGQSLGLKVSLCATHDRAIASRFAVLDAERFGAVPPAEGGTAAAPGELHYTPGVRLPEGPDLTPMGRARIEGRLHPLLDVSPPLCIATPGPETSGASLAALADLVFRETQCNRLVFGQALA